MSEYFKVRRRVHPLTMESVDTLEPVGMNVAELVASYGYPSATVTVGGHPVPEPWQHRVKPMAGTLVTICPVQGRQELALVASLALAVTAPYAGAAAFGSAGVFGTSVVGASLVTAGVSIAGSLAINQLLAPPQPRLGAAQTAAPRYNIGGSQNRASLYEPVPLVIGRHMMFPVKTATPYRQTNGADVWLHERMTFGYGPVVLESLRIGETPVHLFNDVQIEFRNVDQAQTLARYPELAAVVTAWRSGAAQMTLHPDDIVQDAYSVVFDVDVPVTRTTRVNARRIEVEIAAPQGIYNLQSNGDAEEWSFPIRIELAPTGTNAFTTIYLDRLGGAQRELKRWSLGFDMPAPGQYDVRVTTGLSQPPGQNPVTVGLAAIRTIQSGALPSPPELAEMSIRIRASEQLNGPIDSLSGVVNRMVPVWNGVTWTPPQITSHPAWHIADLLRGPMRRKPVPDAKIDRAGLKAWADAEPQRRCDYVADTMQSVRELGDLIAAAGRAKFDFNGTYRVILDQANGPVRQVFTPRNSWGFQGQMTLPNRIDALRVQCMSEAANWQPDEVLVYADGKNESNAEIIEPLELPGTAIRAGETTGGEVWRLGRYHLAQHQLRFETFTLSVDLEHLVTGRGDKVRIVHDMASIGIGQGRVKALTTSGGNLATITLDDVQDVDAGIYRLAIRRSDGVIVEATATGGNLSPVWTVSSGVSAASIAAGDLVAIATEYLDCIIKRITALDDLQATLELVPASPGVLTADVGIIPPYNPAVSRADRSGRPQAPVVTRVFTGREAAQRNNGVTPDQARIGVEVQSQASRQVPPTGYRVWVRPEAGGDWQGGTVQPVGSALFTVPVERQARYEVEVQAVSQTGLESARTRAGTVFAFVDDGAPDVVPDLTVSVLGANATLRWGRPTRNVDYYVVRHSTDPLAMWGEAQEVAATVRDQWVTVPAFNGVYHVRAVNYEGAIGQTSATVVVTAGVLNSSVINTLPAHPDWGGTASGTASVSGSTLVVSASGNNIYDWSDIWDVADVYRTGAVAGAGIFEMADWATLGSVQTVRVSAEVRGGAVAASNDVNGWPNIWAIADIYANAETAWSFRVEISLTDDAGSTPTWGAWQALFAGDYRFRQARFRVVVLIEDDEYVVTLSQLTITIGNT